MWMVRAGRKGHLLDRFIDEGIATVGWKAAGKIAPGSSLDVVRDRIQQTWPAWHPQKIAMAAGQLHRFLSVIQPGDTVITFDTSQRIYKIGTATEDRRFDDETDSDDHAHVMGVNWFGEVRRDDLQSQTRNSLGAISTLFAIRDEAEQDIMRRLRGDPPEANRASDDFASNDDGGLSLEAIEERSAELIADKLTQLDAYEMQELVAGVLRAMGYKTEVSPRGSDRGKDIVASPDGFGFQDPRIVVEVKHRVGTQISAPDLRSFLGGRREGDRCLFVSTGGFSRDALYEADRAQFPVKLMTLADLTEVILANYDALDTPTKALVPLTRVFWPTD